MLSTLVVRNSNPQETTNVYIGTRVSLSTFNIENKTKFYSDYFRRVINKNSKDRFSDIL